LGLSRQSKPSGLRHQRKPRRGLSCVSSVNPKGLSRVGTLAVPTKIPEATKAA